MKSLNDNYASGASSSHETFSDLMFCALIVLVLFIMALAIEVSTRVKASITNKVVEVDKVEEVDLVTMTKEEVAELSEKLQKQKVEMDEMRQQLKKSAGQMATQRAKVSNQMAAMQGEQRFTGAREQASLSMAYDYSKRTFHFLSGRETNHANKQKTGESSSQYRLRQTEEQVAIALKSRKQRGYSMAEASAIYQAFSTYKEVVPSLHSYDIIDSVVGINYAPSLSGYIAGDTELSGRKESLVVDKLLEVYKVKGEKSDEMYPRIVLEVDEEKRKISINGVELSPRDTKEILLSITGRGAMIDLEGLSGKPPRWLTEDVLIPAGYISKTPKLPDN